MPDAGYRKLDDSPSFPCFAWERIHRTPRVLFFHVVALLCPGTRVQCLQEGGTHVKGRGSGGRVRVQTIKILLDNKRDFIGFVILD